MKTIETTSYAAAGSDRRYLRDELLVKVPQMVSNNAFSSPRQAHTLAHMPWLFRYLVNGLRR